MSIYAQSVCQGRQTQQDMLGIPQCSYIQVNIKRLLMQVHFFMTLECNNYMLVTAWRETGNWRRDLKDYFEDWLCSSVYLSVYLT